MNRGRGVKMFDEESRFRSLEVRELNRDMRMRREEIRKEED